MNPLSLLNGVAVRWAGFIAGRRETLLLVSLLSSSMVAFLPFARDTSMANFFIYALLPLILVFTRRERFESVLPPAGSDLALAILLMCGSFAFNSFVGLMSGNYDYGLTDYVILVIGVFSAFYSIREPLAQVGLVLLVILRAATLATSVAYSSAFSSISDFFVYIVVGISKWIVSPNIAMGTTSGEILVGGQAGTSTVFIGWACAGLEELVLISVILYILIASFLLTVRSTAIWLTVGIIGSFFVNIIRMVALVWIAHEYGMDQMMWVHIHLGDVLFLVWVGIFWLLFFRFAADRKAGVETLPPME